MISSLLYHLRRPFLWMWQWILPGTITHWKSGVGEVEFGYGWCGRRTPRWAIYRTPAGEIPHPVSIQVGRVILTLDDWWGAMTIIMDVEKAQAAGVHTVVSE